LDTILAGKNDFAEFCGIWSEEEAATFLEDIADLERVED